jgi:hypothetical protein
MIHGPRLNATIRDAFYLRQQIVRKLTANACERMKLELTLKRLDDAFGGETFIERNTTNDKEHKDD